MSDNDRYAMLIGVSTYDSDAYHDLPPVRADLHYMQAVLESTEIGMDNDCSMVAEPTRAEMLHAIESFLEERQQSETALLYFSGHGEFCEADGQLYFLTRDTAPDDLPGTAVPAEFLERMLQSCRASSKIVLLDCCSSGSVVQGWTAKGAPNTDERPAPAPCCDRPACTSSPRRTPCRAPPPWHRSDPRSARPGSPERSWRACATGGSRTAAGSHRTTSSST
ncbi:MULTISPECIES: caspase family protein [Streptomyces]|uniref:Peptidase C14 caspase domain-containing protein n=1 Tax=Streptomyces luteosporeus TaxID=173856 RepID=A0ABN3TMG6_9ACTN